MDEQLGLRLVLALGLLNLLGLGLVFFSCRCMGGMRLTSRLFKKTWFQRFYKYHCYYWVFLWVSVVTHLVIAFSVAGLPF